MVTVIQIQTKNGESGTRKSETRRNQLSVRYDTFFKDYEVFREKMYLKIGVNTPCFKGAWGPLAGSPENSTGRASIYKKGCVPIS
jgi:hypothetical protein